MLIASPIISAVIYTDDADLTVRPAHAIRFQEPDGTNYYFYVLNSKIGFLADVDDRLVVSPKEDFRRFRMISASMQAQWSGPELFKNGVAVTARITDKENLASFDPNSKADNVISNVSDVLVSTCQHSEPVFEFQPVDANNDDGGGNLPDPDKTQFAKYCYELKVFQTLSQSDGFQFIAPNISTTDASTTAQTLQQWMNKIATDMSTNDKTIRLSNEIITSLVNKYPNFKSAGNTISTTSSFSCIVRVAVTMYAPVNIGKKMVATVSYNGLADTTNGDFFRQVVLRAQSQLNDATLPGALLGMQCSGVINIELGIPIDGAINQRIAVPWPIVSAVSENELTSTPFYDDNFLQPVTAILGGGGFNTTIQYQTSHVFEFVLGDTTVLATAAVANTPTDSEAVVSRNLFNRFQKIMKGMPPAHIMSDAGVTRATMAQFASRGILNDIFNLAAPIASAIFPAIKPFVTAAQPLVSTIDGLL